MAVGAGIVCDKSFNDLDGNFCAASGMWVCDRGETMVDSPVLAMEVLACDCGCEDLLEAMSESIRTQIHINLTLQRTTKNSLSRAGI